MTQLRKLHEEFTQLKEKLFKGEKFIELEDTPDQRRYQQLLGLFHPILRTMNYTNPIKQ